MHVWVTCNVRGRHQYASYIYIYINIISIPFLLDVDDCLGDPCGDHGTCVDRVATFTCTCQSGYDGSLCENSKSK